MEMIETEVSSVGEPVSLAEARQHLRISADDQTFDVEVASMIEAARREVEADCKRCLRHRVQYTLAMSRWPCVPFLFPHPPLRTVDEIAYYDVDDAFTVIGAENYYVHQSTEGQGRFRWVDDYTLPNLTDEPRFNRVQITYTAGWIDSARTPETSRQAILMTLEDLWRGHDQKRIERRDSLSFVDHSGFYG